MSVLVNNLIDPAMGILVDKRTGSGELAGYLQSLGVPVESTTLHFGDFAFLGRHEGDCPVPIGIERKALKDFVSSTRSGRLAGHQLTGLLNSYLETWIVIEGDWRIASNTGHVQTLQWVKGAKGKGKKQWLDVETNTDHALAYQELEASILTLEMKGGMRIRRTKDKMETCRFLAALYHWWTDKSLAQHRSHLKFHSQFADKNLLIPPSLCRVVAATLPGVGFEKSGAVALHFGSVAAMLAATEKDWSGIKGIGPTMAAKIVYAIQVAGVKA